MESLWQDLRYALRVLIKSPGFTIVAILALALGIGANSAIFSVVNAVLLEPLPYKNADGILHISALNTARGVNGTPYSYGRMVHMQEQARSFEILAAYANDGFTLTTDGEPEQIQSSRVTSNLFTLLGVKPEIGRDFLVEEDKPGGNQVAIISYALWQRRFGGQQSVIGKSITLDASAYTVIGVMPPDFNFPNAGTDLWTTRLHDITFLTQEQIRTGAGYVFGVARLKPSVTMGQATSEMSSISQNYHQLSPNAIDSDPHVGMQMVPLKERLVQNVRSTLWILLAAVGFVLLIACANVANLLLARAVARNKEIAVRTALGAQRSRIIRQLLTESIILALIGGGFGLLLATEGVSLISNAGLGNLPRAQSIKISGSVLFFSFAISIITGIIFGLVPALRASRPDLNDTLKDGGRSGTESLAKNRLRSVLVVAEIALSLVLLIGAGLLMQSFARLQSVNPGFDSHNVLAMFISLPQTKYPDPQQKSAFFKNIMERVDALPGSNVAATSSTLPMAARTLTPYQIEGRPPLAIGERPLCEVQYVSADYFKVMSVPQLSGRWFNEHDQFDSQRVAIITSAMAKLNWPNEDPIGKMVSYGRLATPAQIIGVVGDVRSAALNVDPAPTSYMAYTQRPSQGAWLTVKTTGDPLSMAKTVTAVIQAVDKDQAVTAVQSMEQVLSGSVAQPKLIVFLLGIFAALALILASVGIYGVMSYSVTQRTQEIGIRMALGAQTGDVLKLIIRQSLFLAGIGVGIGIVVSLVLTKVMESQLFGIGARDPFTFLVISIFLTAIALFASYIPARRASRVDPMLALRQS
jgi:putative ABC transport system permease protein